MNEPQYHCGCGYTFPAFLGGRGCPNCEGDHQATLEDDDA